MRTVFRQKTGSTHDHTPFSWGSAIDPNEMKMEGEHREWKITLYIELSDTPLLFSQFPAHIDTFKSAFLHVCTKLEHLLDVFEEEKVSEIILDIDLYVLIKTTSYCEDVLPQQFREALTKPKVQDIFPNTNKQKA